MELVSLQSISIHNALVGHSTSPRWDIRVGQAVCHALTTAGGASGCCKDVLNQEGLLGNGQEALSLFEEEGWWGG